MMGPLNRCGNVSTANAKLVWIWLSEFLAATNRHGTTTLFRAYPPSKTRLLTLAKFKKVLKNNHLGDLLDKYTTTKAFWQHVLSLG